MLKDNYDKIKHMLQRPEMQAALADNNLFEVYSFASMLSPALTEFFYDIDIDPLEYLDEVPNYMFKNWKDMSFIELIEIKSIGSNAFENCNDLKYVVMDDVEVIYDEAFKGCVSLEEITIPNNCKEIWDSAFVWCLNLKRVVIPKSVLEIGNNVFGGCDADLTIVCEEDSAAHHYAEDYGFKIELI